jgi:hypothetical protein
VVSFRFHLVSIVGVFLALGLGVLTGTTVLNRGIVAQLEGRTEDLASQLAALRGDFSSLRGEVEVWSAFGDEAMEPLLAGRLDGARVLVFAQDGTDDDSIDGVLRALRVATPDTEAVLGPVFLTGRLSLEAPGDRADLARIVGGTAEDDPDVLRARAADLLADRLAFGPAGNQSLEQLLDGGFLVDEGEGLDEAALRSVGGPGQVVVTLAGGPAASSLRPERFLVPLVSGLARDEAMVAAGEPVDGEEQEPPFVSVLRSDGDLLSRVSTQDNVDQMPGQIGLVLAIEDLLRGSTGHYGVKDGATRPVPEL